jgi:DNA-binding transcriptional LysR family regulator
MLSLNQLRTFMAVAETGSVGGAAEQLAISQPAVSAAIASLNDEFGAPLIERVGRGTRLTPAGSALALHARRIFAMLDQAQRETSNAARNKVRRLRLATVTTVAEHIIANLLRGFRAREPDVDVELYVANRANVWSRLRHWEVDLVIGGRPPDDPAFRTLAVRRNELIAVRAPEYDQEYARATWLLREPGSGTRSATETFFASLDIAPPTLTIGSNGAIRECVRAGIGMSLLSSDAVARELESGALVVVPTPATPLVRNWHLVASADVELPDSAKQFTQYAIETGEFQTDLDK